MLERVEEIDLGYFGDCLDKFLRVRVNIDISKPLRRALNVGVEDSDQMATILFCYDRLPDLCFHCGVLSHPLREWPLRKSIKDVGRPLKYGAWIRAGTTLVLSVSVETKSGFASVDDREERFTGTRFRYGPSVFGKPRLSQGTDLIMESLTLGSFYDSGVPNMEGQGQNELKVNTDFVAIDKEVTDSVIDK
ncbi:hypothetical protein LWI29_001948 [Acer saccharum]|uniref:Zinc knuckle CX2CX4HX4C domain-containing protein n=1 Tax=Acer saccharum TaxID=4024 RepID=A0AA39STV0_ACESA|nr:hypothetical protein LWI29_001948 [Acer saccharum]KAK1584260.1 hypothetical protein Q3G72_031326 [Acer saccharum]